MTDREMFWTLSAVLFLSVMLAMVSIALMVRPAHGSALCLTKSEARQLWPKRHLYWYSKDHCWSNRRGPPSGIKVDPIKNSHAESLPAPASPLPSAGKSDRAPPAAQLKGAVAPTIIFPPLNMRGSVPPEMLSAYAATTWPLIIDIDESDDPELGVTKDGCCWPKMNTLVGQRTKPLEQKR